VSIFTHDQSRSGNPTASVEALARGLGWFSISLGLLEAFAPRALARWLGMQGSEKLLAGYGVREIATGIGILSSGNPAPWIWGRVGGDALDIGTLATGLGRGNRRRENVALAVVAVAGVTALDVMCAQGLTAKQTRPASSVRDYSARRGMPRPPEAMRGAARDFKVPRDMRIPEAMRPYTTG
jgi:hypothetical protein